MKFHVYQSPSGSSASSGSSLPTAVAADSATRAILLFAGWGMDEKPFASVGVEGYRLIVVYDYRDATFPPELESALRDDYEEIAVVAWSFGVPAATRFILSHKDLPLTARIAVNGTMHPVDDSRGIPSAIFRGTLDALDERSLVKFNRRMCGGTEAFLEFSRRAPLRPIDELRDELAAIAAADSPAPKGVWDRAVVGTADRIIPTANQLTAWADDGEAFETITVDSPHLPDFNRLFARFLTRKGLVAEKFTRAETTYDDNAVVQHEIADRLCALAERFRLTVDSVRRPDLLEIGCGTGMTTRMIARRLDAATIRAWDLHLPTSAPVIDDDAAARTAVIACECDAETALRRQPDESFDIIFSASTIQWFNSPATFLRECRRTLRPGGCVAVSTFGPETMHEINALRTVSRHYPTVDAIRRMIPDGCSLLHLSTETRRLTFPTPADALRHVRLTGVNALGNDAGASAVRTILRDYPLTSVGEATVTYQPIYLVFKK